LPLTDIADYGLVWPIWLAWAGIGIMAAAMLLLVAMRRPNLAAWIRLPFLRAPTLRGRLLFGFCCVSMLPILTLPPLLGMNSASYLQDQQVGALEGLVQTVADSIPGMVRRRVDAINGLAAHISADGDFSDPALVDWLLRYHAANTEIVSMWFARPDGHVPVATATRGGTVERWGGPIAGVGVMDYFKAAVEQGGHFVSNVRKGVAAGFDPMVFISAPVGLEGEEPWGYLQAQLNLKRVFGHVVMQDAKAGSEIVITDDQDRIMLSSPRLQFRQFENISAHPLLIAMNQHSGATSFDFAGTIRSSGEQGRYVAAVRQLPKGWRVFAIGSQEPIMRLVTMPLLIGALWVVLTLLLARGFAGLFSDAVAQPLKKLDESLDVFDAERTISIIPQAPSDAPSEVRDVYKKVRDSMRQSRNAYHNMMKALNEGAELKRQLQDISGMPPVPESGVISVVEGEQDHPVADPTSTFRGRMDAVTELPGRELFQEFFEEAWGLGVVAENSLALILLAVGSKNDQTLKAVADALGSTGGRALDLIARIGVHEFAVVLPDTNLTGALAVAERTQVAVRNALKAVCDDRVPEINFGVAAIVPNAAGNPKSFVAVGRRVLQAANKKGDGFIAYADDKGRIRLATKADMIDWGQDVG